MVQSASSPPPHFLHPTNESSRYRNTTSNNLGVRKSLNTKPSSSPLDSPTFATDRPEEEIHKLFPKCTPKTTPSKVGKTPNNDNKSEGVEKPKKKKVKTNKKTNPLVDDEGRQEEEEDKPKKVVKKKKKKQPQETSQEQLERDCKKKTTTKTNRTKKVANKKKGAEKHNVIVDNIIDLR